MKNNIITPENKEIITLESLKTDSYGYNQFTRDKIVNSLEYVSMFEYFKNKKTFDLDTKEGMDLHIYRNKNMYKKAPKDIKTMEEFVKAGYFLFEGFSPCHNLYDEINTQKYRKQTLSQTIYLISHKCLYKPNTFSHCKNVSFRGTPCTSFEGCQFVYNIDTGKLVTDNINRGTWDYGRYATGLHFILDVFPWITFGNGENLETPNMFIMSPAEEKLFLSPDAIDKLKNNEEVQKALTFKEKHMEDEYKKFMIWCKEIGDVVAVKGNEFKTKAEKIIKQSKEDFIDQYYQENSKPINETGLSNVNMAYKDAWFNYVSFLSCIENREIIEGLQDKINYISTNPDNLKDIVSNNEEKRKYEEFIFKSVFNCMTDKERKETNMVQVKLPICVTIHLAQPVIDNIKNIKEKIGEVEARNQYHFFVDYFVTEFNDKVQKYGFEFRLIDELINFDIDIEIARLSVIQIRTVNDVEKTIFNNKIINLKKEKYVDNNPELKDILLKSDEGLVIPCNPEYSSESIYVSTIVLLAGALITLVVGSTALLVDKIDKKKQEPIVKKLSMEIEKLLSSHYDRLKKYDSDLKRKIASSEIVNSFAEYDKYGEYNLYESKDFPDKLDYIREKALELLEIIRRSENYANFIEIVNNELTSDIKLIDGYICKEVFSDITLLDELTKFEFGEDNDDQASKISFLKSMIQKTIDKMDQSIKSVIPETEDRKNYFKSYENEINTNRIGKYPIENQLKFEIGYRKKLDINFEKIRSEIVLLIDTIKK